MKKEKSFIIGMKSFRLNSEKIIKMVEKGNTFLVMRRTRPVFKIRPLTIEEKAEIFMNFPSPASRRGGERSERG